MYGSIYVIEHCESERRKDIEHTDLVYYVTDILHLIGMNVAGIAHGKYIVSSWRDLQNGTGKEQDQRTGDQIAEDVVKKAGLVFGGDS